MIQLGEWLKQIILIVILAVFTDLLLPTKAMQKYVRAVMGLVVIAAILQPIVPYFQRDWADKLAQSAASELVPTSQSSNVAALNPTNVPGLSTYRSDVQAQQAATADQYVEEALTSQVTSQFHCTVNQLTVQGLTAGAAATHVSVVVHTFDGKTLNAIRSYVATALKIPETQVNVQSG